MPLTETSHIRSQARRLTRLRHHRAKLKIISVFSFGYRAHPGDDNWNTWLSLTISLTRLSRAGSDTAQFLRFFPRFYRESKLPQLAEVRLLLIVGNPQTDFCNELRITNCPTSSVILSVGGDINLQENWGVKVKLRIHHFRQARLNTNNSCMVSNIWKHT